MCNMPICVQAGDITVQGVDKERQLETGEIIIIVAVLLMWAGESPLPIDTMLNMSPIIYG